MATQNVCKFNKFGYCKYKELCRNLHVNEKCEIVSCDLSTCMLRHPKLCKYFAQYKQCKFHPCRFEHVEMETDLEKLQLDNQKTSEKVSNLEQILKEKEHLENDIKNCDERIVQFEEVIKKLEKTIHDRNESLNEILKKEETNVLRKRNILQRIEDLEKKNSEKDEKIRLLSEQLEKNKNEEVLNENIVSSMLEKFRKLEERLFTLENESEKTVNDVTLCNYSSAEKSFQECNDKTETQVDLELHKQNVHESTIKDPSEVETIQTENINSEVEVFKCSMCDFETTHNPGLKSHKTKMHVQKAIHSCEQCSETFETRKKLKNHIYCIHSGKYKTLAQLIDEANP